MTAGECFIRIAITPPDVDEKTMCRAVRLLREGEIDVLHLRAPQADESTMRRLAERVPYELRSQVRLHSHFSLIAELGLGGAHLNSRWPEPPAEPCPLSMSCHSEEDILRAAKSPLSFDYVTLSPVWDSISKPGYRAGDELLSLPAIINNTATADCVKVIALGGVTPAKFPLLKSRGFAGAAMLGHYFRTSTDADKR